MYSVQCTIYSVQCTTVHCTSIIQTILISELMNLWIGMRKSSKQGLNTYDLEYDLDIYLHDELGHYLHNDFDYYIHNDLIYDLHNELHTDLNVNDLHIKMTHINYIDDYITLTANLISMYCLLISNNRNLLCFIKKIINISN